jgi:hypothetical protein
VRALNAATAAAVAATAMQRWCNKGYIAFNVLLRTR